MGSLVAELAEKLSSATNNLDFDEQTLFLNTSADTVGIGTNSPGAKLDVRGSAIFNEDSADVDFRIESNSNGNMFFLDGGNDRIGINNGAPAVGFHVRDVVNVGIDDTGHDVRFYGATSGKYWLWDESSDEVVLAGNQTTNGFQQINGYLKLGVNDTGYDFTVYGDTSGKHMLWDASADKFQVTGTSIFDGNVGINDTDPSEAKLSIYANVSGDVGIKIEQDQANNAMLIQQDGDSTAIYVDNNQTGAGLLVDSSAAGYGVLIQQAGAANSLKIDQDGNAAAIDIDNDGTGHGMYIHNAAASSCIYMQQTAAAVGVYIDNDNGNGDTGLYVQNDGSVGPAAYFYSNRDSGQNAPLCVVHADHTGFDNPVLKIINDGAGDGLFIDQNGTSKGMFIEADMANYALGMKNYSSTGRGIYIAAATGDYAALHIDNYQDGTIHYFQGDGNWYHGSTQLSDRRIKENIDNIEYGLTEVLKLTPRKFTFTDHPDIKRHGFIAQEVESVMANMVGGSDIEDRNSDSKMKVADDGAKMSFDYDGMSAVLCKAIQEINTRLTALENA